MDYTTVDIDTQFAHISSELPNVDLLSRKATMWTQAGAALTEAESNFSAETRKLAPDFDDHVGEAWLERAEASQRTLSTWARNVTANNPGTSLTEVSQGITETHAAVSRFKQIADALKQMAGSPAAGASVQAALLELQRASGAVMNQLVARYTTAGDKVAAAGAGGPWEGIAGAIAGGGNRAATFSPTGELLDPGSVGDVTASSGAGVHSASSQVGGATGPSAASSATVSGGGTVSAGSSPPSASSVDASAPELSGGLASPPAMPAAPPAPAAPAGGAGMPAGTGFAPPVMGGAGGVRAGGGGGGGLPRPGVMRGPVLIPVAATPLNPLTSPGVTASAPTVEPLFQAPAQNTAPTGSGAVPPVVPPAGGAMGAGAVNSGTVIGPGNARRARRDDEDERPVPGLPVLLSGKAAVAERFAFTTRGRSDEAREAPATVQFIDEDVWHQSEQAKPVIAGS